MLVHMDEESSYITSQLRKLEKYVRTLPNMRGATSLPRAQRDSLLDLQDALADARKLAHDAATSEVLVVKIASYQRCVEGLEQFRQALLMASQFDLVDTVDVAQLSAMADLVADVVTVQVRRLA